MKNRKKNYCSFFAHSVNLFDIIYINTWAHYIKLIKPCSADNWVIFRIGFCTCSIIRYTRIPTTPCYHNYIEHAFSNTKHEKLTFKALCPLKVIFATISFYCTKPICMYQFVRMKLDFLFEYPWMEWTILNELIRQQDHAQI